MNARTQVLIIIFLLLFLRPTINRAQLSLDYCQVMAYNNYPLIQQFDLIEKSKKLTISNANKAYLPQFDITLIGGIVEGLPSFGPSGSDPTSSATTQLITVGQLNQVIWDGGMTKASKGIITANSAIERAELEINLYQLKERINNLYFGVLLINEQMAQLDLLSETLLRNQKRIKIAIENGTAFRSDEDELKLELINVQLKRDELYYNKLAYSNVLAAMIGQEISEDAVLTRPDLQVPLKT